jgi:hypothetical protein
VRYSAVHSTASGRIGDMPASVCGSDQNFRRTTGPRTCGRHPFFPRADHLRVSCLPSIHRQVEATPRKSGDLVLHPLLPPRSHANSEIATPFAPGGTGTRHRRAAGGGSSSRARHQQVDDTARHGTTRDGLGSRLCRRFCVVYSVGVGVLGTSCTACLSPLLI